MHRKSSPKLLPAVAVLQVAAEFLDLVVNNKENKCINERIELREDLEFLKNGIDFKHVSKRVQSSQCQRSFTSCQKAFELETGRRGGEMG